MLKLTSRALLLLALASLLFIASAGYAQQGAPPGDGLTAQQLIERMTQRQSGLGVSQGEAKLTLIIEDRAGDRRTRAMTVRSKKFDVGTRTLIQLTAPKELAGQAFLFSENKASEDDVWMYLPAFKVARRVEGSQKRGAFLGSHFSFADLESRDVKDAISTRLADEKIGKDDVYVIESKPKDASQSDYGKVIAYIRKSDDMLLKLRFYEKDATTEAKTLFVEKIERGDDQQPYIKQMTLRSKKGGYSTITIDEASTKVELPDALFTREQLGK